MMNKTIHTIRTIAIVFMLLTMTFSGVSAQDTPQNITFTLATMGTVGDVIPLMALADSDLPVAYASSAPGVAEVLEDGGGIFTLMLVSAGNSHHHGFAKWRCDT